MIDRLYRRKTTLALVAGVFACTSGVTSLGETGGDPDNTISRNLYRLPYISNEEVKIQLGYVDHGGFMDITGTDPLAPLMVAPADGMIEPGFVDANNACGCHDAFNNCNNLLIIIHPNNERTEYLHFQQGSISAFVSGGEVVVKGQIIGIEGDVGRTCGTESSERSPTTDTCQPTIPKNLGQPYCLRHLHWTVRRDATSRKINPMLCDTPSGFAVTGQTYMTSACDPNDCLTSQNLSNFLWTGYGTFRLYQADVNIDSANTTVQNEASVVLHAGNSITLQPGFHAQAGTYFRAEIGSCNATAADTSSFHREFQSCRGDVLYDRGVNADDLTLLLQRIGRKAPHACDLDGSGMVDAEDVAELLRQWGPCRSAVDAKGFMAAGAP